MADRGSWTRLLADPFLHLLLIVMVLTCVSLWRASTPAVGYDPISDAQVIYIRHSHMSPPAPRNAPRTPISHAG